MVMLQGLQGRPRVVAPKAIAEASLEYPLMPYSKR
jgi:branched-chain amino acid transport system substrate-binding protein